MLRFLLTSLRVLLEVNGMLWFYNQQEMISLSSTEGRSFTQSFHNL